MVYSGGALKGMIPCARRAGWAYIVINEDSVTLGTYGAMSERYPTVFRADLCVVLEAVRLAVPPLTVHTDTGLVVLGWGRGKGWCCSSRRDGADLWRLFWQRIGDIGQEGISIVKVSSRQTFEHVQLGIISQTDWCGIGMADAWAKAGCAQTTASALVAHFHSRWTLAIAWFRWIEVLHGTGPARHRWGTPKFPWLAMTSPAIEAPHGTHEIWRNRDTAWCQMCGAIARWAPEASVPAVLRRECKGNNARRWIPFGSRTAIQLARIDNNDGALPFAFLASKAAKIAKACDEFVSENASSRPLGFVAHQWDLEYDQEDPFGHDATGNG